VDQYYAGAVYFKGFSRTDCFAGSSLSNYIKENIGLRSSSRQGVKEADILVFSENTWIRELYVKTTEYITREKAAERLTGMLGEESPISRR